MEALEIRFATQMDMIPCQEMDHCKDPVILSRRISAQEIILAEVKGRVVGYLSIQYFWSIIPYMTLIRVKEPFQRQGVGKAMLRFLEHHLREKNHSFVLSSCQADESKPQDWHIARGFKECGAIQGINPGGIDEVFFRKEL